MQRQVLVHSILLNVKIRSILTNRRVYFLSTHPHHYSYKLSMLLSLDLPSRFALLFSLLLLVEFQVHRLNLFHHIKFCCFRLVILLHYKKNVRLVQHQLHSLSKSYLDLEEYSIYDSVIAYEPKLLLFLVFSSQSKYLGQLHQFI